MNTNLKQKYHHLVQSGQIKQDPKQVEIVEHLQSLLDILHFQAEKQSKKGILGQLQSRLYKRDVAPPKGLYIHGGVGRGKSFLMDMFFAQLDRPKQRLHFHEFMIGVHDFIHQQRKHNIQPEKAVPDFAKNLAKRIDVLCFDEFHVTDIADAMILGRLFTALFAAGVTVVATSNWAIDELYKDGLQRDRLLPFLALMHEKMTELHLDNETDYRLARLYGEQVYFYPNNTHSATQFDALFKRTIGTENFEMQAVQVKGRNMKFPKSVKNIMRTDFKNLCGKALGAEDYLEIAKKFDTIFLEQIPILQADERDLAKRFMVMIDAFYERKIKLIILADSAPDKIYADGLLRKEFMRTISRLMEMQSADYLQAQ